MAREREWRIDFWRGIAIAMIFINHVPGNFFSILTSRHWGFSDSAELSVFLSGFSMAFVLTTRFMTRGAGALLYLGYRSFVLYVSHLGLLLAVATVCTIYLELTESDLLIQQMALGPFFSETEKVLRKVLTLTYLPEYMDILPMYIVVLGISGLMFVLFRRRWWCYVVASVALWAAATYFRFNLPDSPASRGWYFNPFCWQAVFTSGFLVILLREKRWFRAVLHSRVVLALSLLVVALGVFGAAPWAFHNILSEWRPITAALQVHLDKQYLSPLRYIHFLACAHIAYRALHQSPCVPLARIWCVIGRNALPTFAMSTVLAVAARAYLEATGFDLTGQLAVTALGLCLIAIFAMFLEKAKMAVREASPAPVLA